MNVVQIRVSRDPGRDSILAVHRSAFGDDEGPVISGLVDETLDDPTGEPILSLVAELDNELAGHVLFTSVEIEPGKQPSAFMALQHGIEGECP
ncbi:hypothetical protein FYK55_26885 [Roseiconus nitratireducens]|uniref:N-acetyltransferase domain-containing protein n=1 Tax=Roseiconus nitratireducens TaxID=2605748 RepID=A0A5M6CW80_9BACT|nr:hypothetical protein [Roseiconus nitratireducens]KAA5538640.1 hypothetical protein FYK55_26885 [Roseiconus nitratireducens]